jgi:hypothetical protein
MALPITYLTAEYLPDPKLRKHPGDLKYAQLAHLNWLIDQINVVLPSDPELLIHKDAANGYVGLTGRQINVYNTAGSIKSTIRSANTAARIFTLPDITGELESIAHKDLSDGYAGLTGFDIDFYDTTGAYKSLFTNANTAVRTYTFQDRTGTIADIANFTGSTTFLPILTAAGSLTDGNVAGTYSLANGEAAVVSGGNNAAPIQLIYIDAAQFPAIAGTTRTMRISGVLSANDVAPTGNFTIGLYPVTRPGTSGGAGVNIYTLGTVVSGSTSQWTTPAADSTGFKTGTAFAMPATGFYAIGVVTTATVATNSHVHLNARLEVQAV